MKSKLLPALLLSIAVIAGTTTITDAFAQTNTERLQTVVETTSDTNDVVHMIMEALSDIIASITAVDEHVHELSEEVSMSTSTITSKLSDIEQTLAGSAALGVTMQQISSDVQSVKMTVEEIDEHVMAMGDNSALEATISDLSTSTNTRLNSLEDSINERFAAIDAQLEGISTSLGVVETTVLPDPDAPETIPTLMNEVKNSVIKASYFATAFSNTNADIANWPKGDSDDRFVLPYDFTFSCDQNVLIDKVWIDPAGPLKDMVTVDVSVDNTITDNSINGADKYGHPILVGQFEDDSTLTDIAATTITVTGRPLVHTNYQTSATSTTVLHKSEALPEDFQLMQLTANSPLQFKSMINFVAYTAVENTELNKEDIATKYGLTVGNNNVPLYPETGKITATVPDPDVVINTYANLTAGNNTQLEHFDFDIFKVNVDYISLSGSNANCELSLPEVSAALSERDSTLVNLVTSGDGLIKTFEAEVTCNDKPAAITGLTASHEVNSSAVGAADLVLEAGGQSIKFNLPTDPSKDPTVTPTDAKKNLPLKFESGNLKISGKVPQVSGILLQVAYQTVSGNSCSVVMQETQ